MAPDPEVETTLDKLIVAARDGDVAAYGRLVEATQRMVHAVCGRILRDPALAEDAAQETFIRAFRRLGALDTPAAFPGWVRRIAVTVAMNMRRARRGTFLRLDEDIDVPILDEIETRWSAGQRHQLAAALLTLTREERRLCDRRYHGGWSTARLASHAAIDEAAMRKRLQRVREKLRKEMEMSEQREMRGSSGPGDLPGRIVELLARPQLTDLPENPVGRIAEALRSFYAECVRVDLPEVLDLAEVRATIVRDAVYVDDDELHRIDARRILRYDLTLPLLVNTRFQGRPFSLWADGKAYRRGRTDATHLEAFHQAEVFWLMDRAQLDPWHLTARVLQSVDRVLPGSTMRIVPTRYPMCTQAWELEVEWEGRSLEVSAWGVFTEQIVRHLGADPHRYAAAGAGYGLERLASLRYGIDDVRKVETATVTQ
jgi:RNA polymerase sigma factor (sigma-70 family)